MAKHAWVKGLDKAALKESLLQEAVEIQKDLLCEYAKGKILEIGDTIKTWPKSNHMDRTGNLLNSLCWGVSYKGKLIAAGFYRRPILRKRNNMGGMNTNESFLHEWTPGDAKYLFPVKGFDLARSYLLSYGNNGSRGWRVFFAILAPYWGYWEKGFKMAQGFTNDDGDDDVHYSFKQFAVMTEYYDVIKRDLKPMRVRFRVSIPKSYSQEELERKWNKNFK